MELSYGNYSFEIANLHISKLSPITMATISKIWLIIYQIQQAHHIIIIYIIQMYLLFKKIKP